MKGQKYPKSDVSWYGDGKSKRPIAYSTVGTMHLIEMLDIEYGGDVEKMYNAVNYNNEAKAVLSEYLKRGIKEIKTFARFEREQRIKGG